MRFARIRLTSLAMGAIVTLGAAACLRPPRAALVDWLNRPVEWTGHQRGGVHSYYRMTSVYTHLDASGAASEMQILEGFFQRSLGTGAPDQEGDRFAWKFVRLGSPGDDGRIEKWKVLPFTRDFTYVFGRWTEERFPVDQTSIPKTMVGWQFFVKLLDAHTFDIIADPGNYDRRLERLGDSARLRGERLMVIMDFPPLFTDTYFVNAPFTTTLRGFTLFGGKPCLLLVFRSEDCRVRLVAAVNAMKLPTEGISSYHGEILLSMETGRVVWGKIRERVDMVSQIPNAPSPVRHATRREITLEEIGRPEFDSLGNAQPGAWGDPAVRTNPPFVFGGAL